tara:strand:- start:62 stop:232 length:171 start_codon:yes stop_codon:yes gene_type:complete
MPLSKRKFYLEVDEVMEVKMKALAGKSYITNKDVEKIIAALVDRTYHDSKGWKLKI